MIQTDVGSGFVSPLPGPVTVQTFNTFFVEIVPETENHSVAISARWANVVNATSAAVGRMEVQIRDLAEDPVWSHFSAVSFGTIATGNPTSFTQSLPGLVGAYYPLILPPGYRFTQTYTLISGIAPEADIQWVIAFNQIYARPTNYQLSP